jgi:hypothetical protein
MPRAGFEPVTLATERPQTYCTLKNKYDTMFCPNNILKRKKSIAIQHNEAVIHIGEVLIIHF